jgi:para-nitrobenzyl esterase
MNFRQLILAAILGVATSTQVFAAPVIIDAPAGKLSGQADGDLNVFKGIPYALPPIGPLRWKPPSAMPRWSDVRDASHFGPACYQPVVPSSGVYTDTPPALSEDCLSLNIWAPKNAHNAPVLFWIHGGALISGWSSEAMYDGARLASRGVIVVSINYRLGVFGYLAHPELSAESPLRISGNYGLLDQIEALRWVKNNINAFGGDPSNVTIDGQSAGGLSVMYLLASPEARGLFAKAIAQSAYMISTPELKVARFGAPSAEDAGVKLGLALHAPTIAALRAIDAATLATAAPLAGYASFGVVDGHVLPRQLVDTFALGEQAHVPLIAGFNSGEIRSLTVLAPPVPASAAGYEKTIRAQYRDLADDFLKLYPASNVQESIWATTRDALYGWTAERLVKNQTSAGAPAYLYYFDHGYPAADSAGLHGFHAAELPYVFGTFDKTPPNWPKVPDTKAEIGFSDAMIDYWTSFMKTGQPTAANAAAWPAYGSGAMYMDFAETPRAADHIMPGMFALQEAVVCRRQAKGDLGWNWNVGLASPPLPEKTAACP